MPLAQAITGVPGATAPASALTTPRNDCAGTTTRMASAAGLPAARAANGDPRIDRHARQAWALPSLAIRAATTGSRAHSVTVRPARAMTLASAVPQAPAPMTAMCWAIIGPPLRPEHRLRRRACRPGRAASARAGLTSSGSVRPSASRSAPAQAIMAPLSVHSAGGGATRRHRSSKSDAMQGVADRLIGRDAAGANQRGRRAEPLAEHPQAVRAAGRVTTSTTACWNEAQRSATSWSLSGAIFSASSRSAVLSPDSEKSASCRPAIGRGSAKPLAVAARRLAARPAARRDSRGRGASRSCRRPRRWRRRRVPPSRT